MENENLVVHTQTLCISVTAIWIRLKVIWEEFTHPTIPKSPTKKTVFSQLLKFTMAQQPSLIDRYM